MKLSGLFFLAIFGATMIFQALVKPVLAVDVNDTFDVQQGDGYFSSDKIPNKRGIVAAAPPALDSPDKSLGGYGAALKRKWTVNNLHFVLGFCA